jgi:hypothetical protein
MSNVVLLRPTVAMPDQVAYCHVVSLALLNALKRLPDLYIQDFAAREVVPLTQDEEKWLWDTWGPSHRENSPVFGRLDAMVDFTSPMWKDSINFVEPNLSGVGGIHFVPNCEQLEAEPFVVQRLARISVSEFPVAQPDGTVSIEPFYMVVGLAPTKYGVAILGRASQKQVVNVAQRGGLCAVMIGRYGKPIHGPSTV